MDLMRGVIVHYNGGEGKRFGFIQIDGEPDNSDNVFFHLSRMVSWVNGGGPEPSAAGLCDSREPSKGQRVVVGVEEGPKGLRAHTIGDEGEYDRVLAECQNRPRYRFRVREGALRLSRLQPPPVYRTLWEGDNLCELRRRYSQGHYTAYSCPEHAREFLMYDPDDDSWEPCEDPR